MGRLIGIIRNVQYASSQNIPIQINKFMRACGGSATCSLSRRKGMIKVKLHFYEALLLSRNGLNN